jgi:hypothetical protein
MEPMTRSAKGFCNGATEKGAEERPDAEDEDHCSKQHRRRILAVER